MENLGHKGLLHAGQLQAPAKGQPLAPTLAEWLVDRADLEPRSLRLPRLPLGSGDDEQQESADDSADQIDEPVAEIQSAREKGHHASSRILGSSSRALQRRRYQLRGAYGQKAGSNMVAADDAGPAMQNAQQGGQVPPQSGDGEIVGWDQANSAGKTWIVGHPSSSSASGAVAGVPTVARWESRDSAASLIAGFSVDPPLVLPRLTAWRSPRPGTFSTIHGAPAQDDDLGTEWDLTSSRFSPVNSTMNRSTSQSRRTSMSLSRCSRPPTEVHKVDRKWFIRQASISAQLSKTGSQIVEQPNKVENAGIGGEYVSFEGWGIDDGYLRSLTKHADFEKIRHIDLTGNRLTAESLTELTRASRPGSWGTLQSLRLARNRLGPTSGRLLARFFQVYRPPLQELDLADNRLGETSCQEICEALSACCYTLGGLSLAQNEIGQSAGMGAALESMIGSLPSLQVLDLHWNSIGSQSAAGLMQGLHDNAVVLHGQLWRVNLAWNRIGARCNDAQMQSQTAKDAPPSGTGGKPATRCNCKTCRACSRAVATLASVFSDCSVLFHLDLSYNGLCAEDCATLAGGLDRNHSLFGLHLDGNEASVDDLGFIVVHPSAGDADQEDLSRLAHNAVTRLEINSHVRHTPRMLRLNNVGVVSRAPDRGPVREKARELVVAREANPSLRNLYSEDAFSSQDIEAEREWVGIRTKTQRCVDFGSGRLFEDVRLNERSCWICENWVSTEVLFIPGWSCPQSMANSIEAVFAYFSIDGFTRPIRLTKTTEKYRERDFRLATTSYANLGSVPEGSTELGRFGSNTSDPVSRATSRRRAARGNRGNQGVDLIQALPDAAERAPLHDGAGRYVAFKGYRMLPPSTLPVRVIFQVNQEIMLADNIPRLSSERPISIHMHDPGRTGATQETSTAPVQQVESTAVEVFQVNVVYVSKKALAKFELGLTSALCLMEDPRLRSDLVVLPRKLQNEKATTTVESWKLSSSVFKDYIQDTDELGMRCYEHDYSISKLSKHGRELSQAEEAICGYLRSNYQRVMAVYHQNGLRGFNSVRSSPGLGMIDFGDLLTKREAHQLMDPSSPTSPQADLTSPPNSPPTDSPNKARRAGVSFAQSNQPGPSRSRSGSTANALTRLRSEADLVFVSATAAAVKNAEVKADPRDMIAMPGQGLSRFQFLEGIVRCSMSRLKASGRLEGQAVVKQLVDDLELGQSHLELRQSLHQALFCEECDVLIRNNKKLLEDCFAAFVRRLPYPGRMSTSLLSYGAWLEFLTACNAYKFGLHHQQAGVAFSLGRQLHVDEYSSYRHMELNFVEFVVCIAAVVRLSIDDFHEDSFPDHLWDFLEEHVASASLNPIRNSGQAGESHLDKLLTMVTELFSEADDDCNGLLNYSEFNCAFRKKGVIQSLKEYGIVEDDLRVLFMRVDADGSGTITLDELITGIVKMKKALTGLDRAVACLRKAFAEADQDGSGTLSKDEFQTMLSNQVVRQKLQGIGVSMEEVDDLWEMVDVSNPEGVTSHEMIAGLLALRDYGCEQVRGRIILRHAFRQLDVNDTGAIGREEVETAMGKFGVADKLAKLGLPLPDLMAMYDEIDYNCDGKISWEELERGVTSIWSCADSNPR